MHAKTARFRPALQFLFLLQELVEVLGKLLRALQLLRKRLRPGKKGVDLRKRRRRDPPEDVRHILLGVEGVEPRGSQDRHEDSVGLRAAPGEAEQKIFSCQNHVFHGPLADVVGHVDVGIVQEHPELALELEAVTDVREERFLHLRKVGPEPVEERVHDGLRLLLPDLQDLLGRFPPAFRLDVEEPPHRRKDGFGIGGRLLAVLMLQGVLGDKGGLVEPLPPVEPASRHGDPSVGEP